MNAVTAFEHRKDELRAQLEQAKDVKAASAACAMALEQTACELAQDEQDENARQRQQAVMALARRMPAMMEGVKAKGELVLEENNAPEDRVGRALQLGGVLLLTGLAVYEYACGRKAAALLQAIGALLFAAGAMRSVKGGGQSAKARAYAVVDAQAVLLQMTQLMEGIDLCVSDLALLEADGARTRLSGTADDAMLDLLVALMEAKASGRDAVAMRSLNLAEEYLRMLGIDVVAYDPAHANMFDALPTMGESRTVRPALMKDGRLIRRGVAAVAASVGRSVGA